MRRTNAFGWAGLAVAVALLGAARVDAKGRGRGIQVRVDRAVELISIVWRLAGVPEYTKAPDGPYTRAVEAHFRKHRDHPAVKAAEKLYREHSISFNAPVALAVHLDPKTLKLRVPLAPFPDRLDSRWRKAPTTEFLEQVRTFARDAGFDAFFTGQRKYLSAVEGRYRKALAGRDPLGWCQAFFGPKRKVKAILTPCLLCGPNGYGTSVLLPDGTEELRPVLGVSHLYREGLPAFDRSPDLAAYLQHEIAHAYANPIVDAKAAALEPIGRRLFAPVAEAMKSQAYAHWKVMMYETLVRASTVLYLKDRFGEAAAAAAQARDRGRSFAWIAVVVRALDGYRKEDRPPRDLAAFVPQLVEALNRWADTPESERRGIFPGPINAVFAPAYRAADRMLVVGPAPAGTKASKALAEYVAGIHKSFYAEHGVALKAASEVSADAPRSKGLVLYGTPAANPVLKKILKRFGWQIGPKSIRVGRRTFKGADLVLVACHPHPDDAKLPVLIYAAARPELLPGINGLFHGPTDWIVVRRISPGRFEELAKGDFPKGLDGSWKPLPR